MAIIIGSVGKPCAGKGTFGKFLKTIIEEDFGIRVQITLLRFSDALRAEADAQSLPQTREILQKIARDWDHEAAENGEDLGVLSRKVGSLIKQKENEFDVIYVDGVRWWTDLQMLLSFEHNMLVSIEKDIQKRYKASLDRGENVGEKEKTFLEFCNEDEAENERFIHEIAQKADYIIFNDCSEEKLGEQVRTFVRNHLTPFLKYTKK